MLEDIIRKWWRAQLCLADESGAVVDWQQSAARNEPGHLFSSAGEELHCCSASIRLLQERFTASRMRGAQSLECHPGFIIVGAPLYSGDVYRGFLFVQGLVRQPRSDRDGFAAEVGDAAPGVPMLSGPEFEKLGDLLESAANEIASRPDDETKHHRRTPSAPSGFPRPYRFENIVGNSEPMRGLFRLLEKVCNSESTVLISGESGTGKELVARAICGNGPRRDEAFVVQNCSAFNDNLLETALFGHVRGSFTGALHGRKGLFEIADGGTFFLDEVGDMSPALQVKLLRVLEEGSFLPVGGTQLKQVDVRLIAATHKDLARLVEEGAFREDLFYRINVIRIHVPPLRERREDIPVLVDHFMRKHRREGQRARSLSPDASRILAVYSWPGNVRELENEIERLLVLGSDFEVIPAELISPRILEPATGGAKRPAHQSRSGKLNEMIEDLEREVIRAGLLRTHYNKSRLARELGVSRSNLILKISRYGLDQPGAPPDDEAATV